MLVKLGAVKKYKINAFAGNTDSHGLNPYLYSLCSFREFSYSWEDDLLNKQMLKGLVIFY